MYDLISVVDKMDDNFSRYNQRVLEIKGGVLQYYSKVPKDFDFKKIKDQD
jgi:hypothetical protein